jgi:hypothetical protein
MRSLLVLVVGIAFALPGFGLSRTARAQPVAASPAQAAMASAAGGGKYQFILFYKQDDAATQAVRQTLEAALAKRSGQAGSVLVRTTDPAEKAVVDQFGVSRSPMPLVLAVAPNGAVTGGFPLKLTERDIAGAFVSPGTAACLKGAQARKLVLLCVRPAQGSIGLPGGVAEMKADPQYGPATEVVTVRADDAAEAVLLKVLELSPKAGVVTTALLVPPGRRLAVFEGPFTREQVAEKLRSAQGGCCPGGKCGPGGCCPGGKCGPN